MKILPDETHVLRYCAPRTTDEHGRATSASFELFPKDKGYLSINNLDRAEGSMPQKIALFSIYYSTKIRKGKPLQENTSLAELEVGSTKHMIQSKSENSKVLRFVDKSHSKDLTYAGIEGLELDDFEIFEMLAQSVLDNHAPV